MIEVMSAFSFNGQFFYLPSTQSINDRALSSVNHLPKVNLGRIPISLYNIDIANPEPAGEKLTWIMMTKHRNGMIFKLMD